jgi:hypothetical protein
VVEDDLAAICVAALQGCPDETLVVSLSAARLHEMWLPPGSEPIQLATASSGQVARAMSRTRRSPFVAQRRELLAGDRTTLGGVPITTAVRTWGDPASTLPGRGWLAGRAGLGSPICAHAVGWCCRTGRPKPSPVRGRRPTVRTLLGHRAPYLLTRALLSRRAGTCPLARGSPPTSGEAGRDATGASNQNRCEARPGRPAEAFSRA